MHELYVTLGSNEDLVNATPGNAMKISKLLNRFVFPLELSVDTQAALSTFVGVGVQPISIRFFSRT